MSGWVKLHRKMLDNPVVCKDSDYIAVWVYLLLKATHKEHPAIFKKEKIMLQPGQLITGRKSISEKLSIQESKVTRILNCFENEHQIEQQTSNKNRLITILSWSDYQESEQQNEQEVNNKRTTNEQQMNTNKNVRNKEYKEDISTTTSTSENPFKLFESEGFGTLSAIICERLGDLIDSFGEVWVCEAMREAVIHGKRSIAYVTSILNRWQTTGIDQPWKEENDVKHGRFPKGVRSGTYQGTGTEGESEYAFLGKPGRS